jgi:phosphoribosylamine--glycine ligase
MASAGYPLSSSSGDVITGLDEEGGLAGVEVYHAGTAEEGGRLVTDGGRVLAVSALGASFTAARDAAYDAVGRISFDGMQFREDIAAEPARTA